MLSQKLATLKTVPYNILTLDYPITRSYPWRWFGPLMILSSIPVILLLTALNIFTVGTETITYESSEYHTGATWLYDLAGQQAPTVCDPARLRIGDTLRTNFGSFDYTLVAINGTGGSNAAKAKAPTRRSFGNPSYGFEYSGADVANSCYSTDEAGNIYLRFISLFADLNAFTMQGEVKFFCTVDNGGIAQLRLARLTRPLSPQLDDYQSSLFESPNFLYHTVTRALVDSMAVDVLQSMRLASDSANDTSLAQVTVTAAMLCPDWSKSRLYSPFECPLYLKRAELNSAVASLVDRGRVRFLDPSYSADLPAGLQTSLANYIAAFYMSNLLDLGVWTTNSLLSPELFNRTILQNDALTNALTQQSYPEPFHVGSSAVPPSSDVYNQTVSRASYFRSPPTFFVNDSLSPESHPAWAVSYTCRRTRLKKPLGLIVSVLIGDVALFGLIWGFVMYLPTNIAQRRDNTCSACGSGATTATGPATSSP